MKSSILYSFLLPALLAALLLSCNASPCPSGGGEYESLYNALDRLRHTDKEALREAVQLVRNNEESGCCVHLPDNFDAYCALMDMDYARARGIYEGIISHSDNELERLEASVGMMRLCQRVSANREFYDYRQKAERCLQRLDKENFSITPAAKRRLEHLRLNYNVISANYFAALALYEEYDKAAAAVVNNLPAVTDTAMVLDAGLVSGAFRENGVSERFSIIYRGLNTSVALNDRWHSGHYKMMLAIMLRDDAVRDSLYGSAPGRLQRLCGDSAAVDELPILLAEQSIQNFESCGDRYMVIKGLAVLASCHTYRGEYELSLDVAEYAIDEVNRYYSDFYGDSDTLSPYTLFPAEDSLELKRMAVADVVNIPECMLLIRNEVSCAYAALGDKEASDANRNSYLDLLHVTRQNSEMESRARNLVHSATLMSRWVMALVLLLVAVAAAAVLMVRRWRRNNNRFTTSLMGVLGLCRELTAFPLLCEFDDKEDVDNKLTALLKSSLASVLGNLQEISIVTGFCDTGDRSVKCFALGGEYCLKVATRGTLAGDELAIMDFLLPYISVARADAERLVEMGDERTRLEELNRSYAIGLAEHKRENILKRASLSVVAGMRPYMDRMSKELSVLAASCDGDVEGRLNYIAELTDKLNEYNTILERWIKMRRGELSLNVENFSLLQLFDIIAKSSQALSMRGLTLKIAPCNLYVKADKALTLFMINTLVDNAAKFTQPGGVVEVSAVEVDGCVEVAVSDSGAGLSAEEVRMILDEKVYDAATIGNGAGEVVAKNKGGGFGLMNCRGIIEKYKKTDALFSVCSMNVESKLGKGSRFSFRLPKGVVRLILLLLTFVPSAAFADARLDRVSALADSVYLANVGGDYNTTLEYAQRVVNELNGYYLSCGGTGDTLRLSGVGEAAEISWWREGFATDSLMEIVYYNMLDVRNEAAVALLALQRWADYRYNNNAYTSLHRLVHEDKNLATYYSDLRRTVNARQVTVALTVALLIFLVGALLLYYFKQSVMNRVNLYSALEVNKCLLKAVDGKRLDTNELVELFAAELHTALGEMMRVGAVRVAFNDVAIERLVMSHTGDERLAFSLQRAFESSDIYLSADRQVVALPLVVTGVNGGECVGAIAIETDRRITVNEKLMLQIVAGYVATVGHHATVGMAREYRSFDELVEESNRMKYEENVLHVQNQVLDNCLSMIKHETVYYPSRIHKLVTELMNDGCEGDVRIQRFAAMGELMEYYNSVYKVLVTCAMNQLSDVVFTPTRVPFAEIAAECTAFVKRRARRCGLSLQLHCDNVDAVVYGDRELMMFLLESVLTELLAVPVDGNLHMRVEQSTGTSTVEILDTRRHIDKELREAMFVPSALNVSEKDDTVVGVGFLLAKEIVRMHEDYMGRYGGRVEAVDEARGTIIRFTFPG